MATNGVLKFINHEGDIVCKLIVGCDGHRDKLNELADTFTSAPDPADLYIIAENMGIGCERCRVVMYLAWNKGIGRIKTYNKCDDGIPSRYWDVFDKDVNPRWEPPIEWEAVTKVIEGRIYE